MGSGTGHWYDRPPPLTPAACTALLQTMKFTNGADCELVANLYRTTFDMVLGGASKCVYNELGWGDEEFKQMCDVLPSLTEVDKLVLMFHNNFTDVGANHIARVLDAGAMPKLRVLDLNCDDNETQNPKMGTRDAGAAAVREACAKRGIRADTSNW